MKEIREELKKLGDTVATSFGTIVIGAAVFLAIAIVMRAIYCKPPEERDEGSSHGGRARAYMMNQVANPVNKGRPFSVYHR